MKPAAGGATFCGSWDGCAEVRASASLNFGVGCKGVGCKGVGCKGARRAVYTILKIFRRTHCRGRSKTASGRTTHSIIRRYAAKQSPMVPSSLIGASSLLHSIRRLRSQSRTPPLLQPSHHREAKCDCIYEENWKKHPPPGDHDRDLPMHLVALCLVDEREVKHGFEPCLGCPVEFRIVDTDGVGCDGFTNVLACRLVCDYEDKDEGGEREENRKAQ
jgi:hypothetical protein